MKQISCYDYHSPLGTLHLEADKSRILKVCWQDDSLTLPSTPNRLLMLLIGQLDQFFAGKRTRFDLPLALDGTPFQLMVWQRLSHIEYGSVMSYKQLAQSIHSNAVRAVGTACAANPFHLIIPCHRIVRGDGDVGNYAGGADLKKALLRFEQQENF